jgi:hypothetical protein
MNIKRLTLMSTVVAAVGGLQLLSPVAATGASSSSSCVGIESSSISPPGSSEEFPGGRAQLEAVIRELAHQLGVPPGEIVSQVAHLHEGSHEACDEATG